MQFKSDAHRKAVMANFHKRHPMQARVDKTVVKQSLNDLRIAKSLSHNMIKTKKLNVIEHDLRNIASNKDRDNLLEKIRSLQDEEIPYNMRRRLESIKRNIEESGAFEFGKDNSSLLGNDDYSNSMHGVINKKEGIRTKKEKPESAQMRWIYNLR